MPIIIVPKIIERIHPSLPLIFLAGPIRGGGDWQWQMATALIRQCPDVQIACPCRWNEVHPLSSYFVRPFSPAPNRQLYWERHYMERAALNPKQRGCVLFWFGLEDRKNPHQGPGPYAMDTRREIGKFTAFKKMFPATRIVVGGSEAFYGLSVIRDELDDATGVPFPFYTDMGELANMALQTATRD